MNKTELIALAKALGNADRSAPIAYSVNGQDLSYEAMNETLRKELNELTNTPTKYRENSKIVFSIIEEVMNDVLPKKVQDAYAAFADVRTFGQGDKPLFRRKINSRNRAKQFVTRVGLAGVYEVFKLGGEESFEVPTSAIGGAAQVSLEEFLDGRVDFAEITEIVMEGMNDLIYREVAQCMQASIRQLPSANRYAYAGFDENAFDTLMTIASAYGDPTIYCTYEFAVKMLPQDAWRYTEAMKDELYRTGRLAMYKGHRVIILPQTFEDETNAKKVIDPGYCWIIPTGVDDKPVKIAFEGQTLVDERKNDDWSREIQVYKKVGVTALFNNAICSYVDTSLQGHLTDWQLTDGVNNTVKVLD